MGRPAQMFVYQVLTRTGGNASWGETLMGFRSSATTFPYGPETQRYTGWSNDSAGIARLSLLEPALLSRLCLLGMCSRACSPACVLAPDAGFLHQAQAQI